MSKPNTVTVTIGNVLGASPITYTDPANRAFSVIATLSMMTDGGGIYLYTLSGLQSKTTYTFDTNGSNLGNCLLAEQLFPSPTNPTTAYITNATVKQTLGGFSITTT